MNTKKISISFIAPVLLSFFVMSFCDLVGVGVDNAKFDFGLNNTLAQLIPLAVFAWFFILSVPVGLLQDRIGKRNMLNTGMILTSFGLLLPFFLYSFPVLLAGFAFLGIGNTIIQVSANPLLIDVVPSTRASSFLSLSQFVKAVGSMVAPYLATFFVIRFGDWKLLLLTFGFVSLLSVLWLLFTKISETPTKEEKATMASSLRLLGTGYIVLMVLCIFFVVGLDVGINSLSGQFLMEKVDMMPEPAKQGRSFYFFGKMLGTFLGALFLFRVSPGRFLVGSSVATFLSLLSLIYAPTSSVALILLFLTGFTAANIFPLVFSITVRKYTRYTNEISGLMIMAVSGGAFIPPLAGKFADLINITMGMYVFVVCAAYIVFVSFYTLSNS